MKKFFQNWKQLLFVQMGGAICLPIIMIGQTIGSMFGLIPGLISAVLGNLFLMGIGILISIMSVKKRKSTSEIATNYFGKKTSMFFSLLLSFTMIGWFGIQLNFISQNILLILSSLGIPIMINPLFICIFLGVLMTFCSLFGIKPIRTFSVFVAPILMGILIIALFLSPISLINTFSIGAILNIKGLSMIIGGAIGGVIDFPTYFQHAKNVKHSIITSTLLFGIVFPFVEIAGIFLGACFPHSSLLSCLIAGSGIIWTFIVSIFLIFSGWTSNNLNIYSAVINSKKIFSKISLKIRTIFFGLLGTLLSTFGLISHLSLVMSFLGIFIGSMGAITLSSFLIESFMKSKTSKFAQISNTCIFAISIFVGVSTLFNFFTITHLPILDAFITAFIATFSFRAFNCKKVTNREIVHETN